MKNKSVHSMILAIWLIMGVFLMLPNIAMSQKNATRQEIKDEIRLTDELLEETRNNEEKSISELLLLSNQIGLREQYLEKLKEEIISQNHEIEELNKMICQMEKDIEQIMNEYAETAQTTYKGFDNDNFWLSLLSSGSISEAYYRAVYFQQFSQYRKKQVHLIKRTQKFLTNKSAELKESVLEKELLIAEQETETKKVNQSKKVKEKLYTALIPKEKSIRKTVKTHKEEIKSKIQHSEDKIQLATPNVIKTSTESTTTVESNSIDYAKRFLKNKGKMSWPVPMNKGIITERFGKSEDPYGNQIVNDGIYIRTTQGQSVKAVFTGKVTGVQKLPMGGGEVVIIEHGNYRTVYANLESSIVKANQFVKKNEVIGKVKTDKRTGETLLNFLIYKFPDQFDDPEKWIKRK